MVLVEGRSDAGAVSELARCAGRDLDAEGVAVLPMAGATNIRHCLAAFGVQGRGLRVVGLCDVAETRFFVEGLRRTGYGDPTPEDLPGLGFQICVKDLEDELIRALGVPVIEEILAAEGHLSSFRTFQRQPAQAGRPDTARLRRFFGSGSGRKIHYGPVLVRALGVERSPAPLKALLDSL
nr:TOPRIM nucleotidyl transferase/hydrolase domain-containing protein [Nakamurella alba]